MFTYANPGDPYMAESWWDMQLRQYLLPNHLTEMRICVSSKTTFFLNTKRLAYSTVPNVFQFTSMHIQGLRPFTDYLASFSRNTTVYTRTFPNNVQYFERGFPNAILFVLKIFVYFRQVKHEFSTSSRTMQTRS